MRVVSRYHFEDAFSMSLKLAQNFDTNSAVPLKRDLDFSNWFTRHSTMLVPGYFQPSLAGLSLISGEVLTSVVRG